MLPTAQRNHIQDLLRDARNLKNRNDKWVFEIGLSYEDLAALATEPQLKVKDGQLSPLFDDHTATSTVEVTHSFDQSTGVPKLWAIDLAMILDLSVEQVFKYEAEQLIQKWKQSDHNSVDESERESVARNDIYGSGALPLYNSLPLEMAANVADARHFADPESAIRESQSALERLRIIKQALEPLNLKERHALHSRIVEGKTLEESGDGINVTAERVRQLETKALRKLNNPHRKRMFQKALEA